MFPEFGGRHGQIITQQDPFEAALDAFKYRQITHGSDQGICLDRPDHLGGQNIQVALFAVKMRTAR